MKTGRPYGFLFTVLIVLVLAPSLTQATQFVAYSLREAEQQLQQSSAPRADVHELGGITHIVGMVYDAARQDVIIVGQASTTDDRISLDDVVIALRALFIHHTWPLVSIDKTAETETTGKQTVRFQGGLAHSAFGRDLLGADVFLKKMALGLLSAETEGIRSYVKMSVHYAAEHGLEEHIGTRFWFYPLDGSSVAVREGVFAIRELKVGVRTQVMHAVLQGKPLTDVSTVRDQPAEEFAAALTAHLDTLSAQHPVLKRLQTLFALVALAQGIQSLPSPPDLGYWLREYPVPQVTTPEDYPLLTQKEEVRTANTVRVVEIDGGIELKALLLRLKDGDVTALRDAVLKSRPAETALTWPVPIAGWRLPGTEEATDEAASAQEVEARLQSTTYGRLGSYVTRHIYPLGVTGTSERPALPPPPLMPMRPAFETTSRFPWTGYGGIGGVMLANTARVEGLAMGDAVSAAIDQTTGSFNLIVQGKNVRVSDLDLRKFITVLWAVYFGEEDPGISIDPIAPEADRQLVRFIGNIMDTALAKTLLDADYYMKKCAIGTEHPPIPGFQDVDQLIGGHGLRYLGTGRRFWFVPQDMRFRQAGNALLFEGGRMTLMTEKLLRNIRGETDASDQAFAQFWTEHYWEFAAANPVYEELFAYAKMTALAKYLKQSGVSLQWFLLANRHLILKDKLPGSVAALRAPSNVLQGVQWVGGVDLGIDMSNKQPGRYVLDDAAATALRQAYARYGTPAQQNTTGGGFSTMGDKAMTAELQDGTYTILPAKVLVSGTGAKGVTFHTDMALRANGEPGVELVRYNAPGWKPGMFGAGWQLYIPYGIALTGNDRVKATQVAVQRNDGSTGMVDVLVPQRMEVVDLVDGTRETLSYDDKRFGVAAWVPADADKSRFEGMAYLTDGSCLLFEKSGARFRFDAQTRPTDLIFSAKHAVHFHYDGRRITSIEDGFGGKVALQYDETGKIVRAAGPQGEVQYRYLDNELVSVQSPQGQKLSLIYDRNGKLDEVVVRKGSSKG
ncbi:MAG: hypothetical protein HY268_32515 [Deltaproteobacteria bacterium]|nr:hypothetical protein [Deltaproteobacteria bacterium]